MGREQDTTSLHPDVALALRPPKTTESQKADPGAGF